MKGFVYVLTNVSMPGLVKIGKTTRSVEQRALELYQTGVPEPFIIASQVATPDCGGMEAEAHAYFQSCRVSPSREFFWCDPPDAEAVLRDILMEQVSSMVEAYLPCHVLVSEMHHVDPSTLEITADRCGLRPYEMDQVFCELTAEDMAPAAQRYLEACARRKQRVLDGLPAWPVKAEDEGAVVH